MASTAKQLLHKAIDNTTFADNEYPDIKRKMHKAVDDMTDEEADWLTFNKVDKAVMHGVEQLAKMDGRRTE